MITKLTTLHFSKLALALHTERKRYMPHTYPGGPDPELRLKHLYDGKQ